MRNPLGFLALLATALLMAGACDISAEDTPAPTEVPTVARHASSHGIGVSRTEMQAALEKDPFGFTFDPLSNLTDGRSRTIGYLLEEGQEGMVELIGPPGNLTTVTLVTPITGAYSHTGLSRLSEVAFRTVPQWERGQGADLWVVDHILPALEEGTQSTRYDDTCLEMQWFENLQFMTLVVERCAP